MIQIVSVIAVTISVLILILIVINFFFEKTVKPSSTIKYGVSFSPIYAESLGLDWQDLFAQILDDLGVKYLRLPTYWNVLERIEGELDFSQTDFMLSEAKERGVKVLLVVGAKQPRWPECHIPDWALSLPIPTKHQKILEFTKQVVERYKDSPIIWGWQVENEPFFGFGENCDSITKQLVEQEVELVRKVDPNRPIVLTETGEWRLGTDAMQLSDIFGISLYRSAYMPIIGSYNYPFPASYYYYKSTFIRKFFAPSNKKTIITELQAEPWVSGSIIDTPIERQLNLFSIERFLSTIEFAKKTGFEEIYLWGVEWWYFMKENNHPEYWEYAKELFKTNL